MTSLPSLPSLPIIVIIAHHCHQCLSVQINAEGRTMSFASLFLKASLSSIHCQLLVFFELWLLKHVEQLAGWTLHDMKNVTLDCNCTKMSPIKGKSDQIILVVSHLEYEPSLVLVAGSVTSCHDRYFL